LSESICFLSDIYLLLGTYLGDGRGEGVGGVGGVGGGGVST